MRTAKIGTVATHLKRGVMYYEECLQVLFQ